MSEETEVIVELYGIPRLRAGRAEVRLPPGTVAEVLCGLEENCPELRGLLGGDGRLSRHYLLSLEGQEFLTDPARMLHPGDRVLLLSADAGG
jgi:hypothetical protein